MHGTFLRVCAMYTYAGCQYGGHMLTWGELVLSFKSVDSFLGCQPPCCAYCWSCKGSSFICVSHLKARCFGFFFSVDQNNSQKNFFSLNLDSLSLLKSCLSVLRRQVISVDELCHA